MVECAWCHITETLDDDVAEYRGKFYHYECLRQKIEADAAEALEYAYDEDSDEEACSRY